MKKIFFPVFILLFVINAVISAQKNDNSVIVCNFDEHRPEFPGGDAALLRFIAENTQYPTDAVLQKIEGKVFIQFTIEKDSTISHLKVLRGLCTTCDSEAVRVVKRFPKFKPAMQNGQIVKSIYNIAVTFPPVKIQLGETLSFDKNTKNNPLPCEKVADNRIWLISEKRPEFPGGERAMFTYIRDHIKYSPRFDCAEGKIYIQTYIEADGNVTNVKVLRGIQQDIDEEVIRVVKSLPKFKPGMQYGQSVRVQYNFHFPFKIE